ncbi:MAG: cytochrome b [Betaproteobacteria bacterium]
MVAREMPARNYGRVAKLLHWLMFALVAAQFVVAFLMPDIGRGTVPGTLINLHLSIGFTIIVVIVLRWLWRMGHPVPLDTDDGPRWQHAVARVTHALLYVLLLANPFLGWANASARDWNIDVFGLFRLPHLVAARSQLGRLSGDVHIYLAWTLLGLIALHVAAALYHYFVRHDRVLQRMLPGSQTE